MFQIEGYVLWYIPKYKTIENHLNFLSRKQVQCIQAESLEYRIKKITEDIHK